MANILIVDDSLISRMKLKRIIETSSHQVIGEAADGNEAYEKYEELKPDIVTMDITMPNLDGISALKKIMNSYDDAKVIMITALGQGNKILDALNNGAKNYITKPFDEEKVLTSIEEALTSE
ncbi:response regulator [Clostridium akagii]|uniref:response regulator n=1 Tax=Clostridium akagii TaxID=91623 RepID=UPI0004799688|nr:response regulator [Clostridium akagii]